MKYTEEELNQINNLELCAEVMGYTWTHASKNDPRNTIRCNIDFNSNISYYPYEDDSQAFKLAKKFMLELDISSGMVQLPESYKERYTTYSYISINHAIIECVTKLIRQNIIQNII